VYVGRLGIKAVVGVLGGADTAFSRAPLKEHRDRIYQVAYELGKRLAELQSVHLLTGGGGA
jgi:predicted Rossmann-fold nucleotide-binding protein